MWKSAPFEIIGYREVFWRLIFAHKSDLFDLEGLAHRRHAKLSWQRCKIRSPHDFNRLRPCSRRLSQRHHTIHHRSRPNECRLWCFRLRACRSLCGAPAHARSINNSSGPNPRNIVRSRTRDRARRNRATAPRGSYLPLAGNIHSQVKRRVSKSPWSRCPDPGLPLRSTTRPGSAERCSINR